MSFLHRVRQYWHCAGRSPYWEYYGSARGVLKGELLAASCKEEAVAFWTSALLAQPSVVQKAPKALFGGNRGRQLSFHWHDLSDDHGRSAAPSRRLQAGIGSLAGISAG